MGFRALGRFLLYCGSISAAGAMAETLTFDTAATGALPPQWACGVTGSGTSKWTVEADSTAPSRPNVLRQSGVGAFPWCVVKAASLQDGAVEVKFRAISGRSDQAGGLVWRWKDANHYYVARANALENNVSLYYTAGGRRNTLQYVDAPVAKNTWHTLCVEFVGETIRVMLNG